MRTRLIFPLFAVLLATNFAIQTSIAGDDPVASAKAKMDSAYGTFLKANARLDAARAEVWRRFDATTDGKILDEAVKKARAAMDAAPPADATLAEKAFEDWAAAKRKQNDSRRDREVKDSVVIAEMASTQEAKTSWTKAKAALHAAVLQKSDSVEAGDPNSKHKRDVAKAIGLGEFINGMTEAEADAAAKTFDDPKAPMKRSVENKDDGSRVIEYLGFWVGDPKPGRIVILTFKDGSVVDISDVRRTPAQSDK